MHDPRPGRARRLGPPCPPGSSAAPVAPRCRPFGGLCLFRAALGRSGAPRRCPPSGGALRPRRRRLIKTLILFNFVPKLNKIRCLAQSRRLGNRGIQQPPSREIGRRLCREDSPRCGGAAQPPSSSRPRVRSGGGRRATVSTHRPGPLPLQQTHTGPSNYLLTETV